MSVRYPYEKNRATSKHGKCVNQYRKDDSKLDPCSKPGYVSELMGATGDLKALEKTSPTQHTMSP